MGINGNFQNLYNQTKMLNIYNEYSELNKKKKRTDEETAKLEELKKQADANNDGKINSKDSTKIKSSINSERSNVKTYDFNNNDRIDLSDLVMLNKGIDIDGDGTISDNEKKFIENEQKELINKLKKSSDKKEYDVNGDGKVDKADVVEFLNLTSGIDFRSEGKNDDFSKYLKSFQNNLNKKVLDTNSNEQIGNKDLAHYTELKNQAQKYINNETGNSVTEKYALKNLT